MGGKSLSGLDRERSQAVERQRALKGGQNPCRAVGQVSHVIELENRIVIVPPRPLLLLSSQLVRQRGTVQHLQTIQDQHTLGTVRDVALSAVKTNGGTHISVDAVEEPGVAVLRQDLCCIRCDACQPIELQASSMLHEHPGCLRGKRLQSVEGERAGKTCQDHEDFVRHRGDIVEPKHWGIATLGGPLPLLHHEFLRQRRTLQGMQAPKREQTILSGAGLDLTKGPFQRGGVAGRRV